eukprot:TRINITY_DN114912_c0_g1_i1.p1 TRINITY_DN114912_c0_g1~~TRINITY_DN114912_c0_g1_i1.p1  ORF type:complete len:122 (+),score=41.18 TRINITY_DN114912_c0_g1_i1:105-470(+)
MAEEVKMKLVFVNDSNSAELTVANTTVVSELKTRIQQEFWPATQPALETVERLRLFAGGKEIGGQDGKDNQSLREAMKNVTAQSTMPVHVHPVEKTANGTATSSAKEGKSENTSQCGCILL